LDHSPEFRALRDAILDDLGDEDRRRLAALLGCMTEPQPELSPSLAGLLGEIARLSVNDRRGYRAGAAAISPAGARSPSPPAGGSSLKRGISCAQFAKAGS
jgi:hypothetical protein